jgi:hypothetical protein
MEIWGINKSGGEGGIILSVDQLRSAPSEPLKRYCKSYVFNRWSRFEKIGTPGADYSTVK